MNYRHAYHAGNFADVFKHVVLIALIEALKAKQAAFAVLDTHAGAGRYSLSSEEALKTGEFRDGVMRLVAAERLPTLVHAYLHLVQSQNGAQTYPGSPLIAAQLLRDHDRLMLCEIQDAEVESLRQLFGRDARVAVHQRDGYQSMAALLPPPEKRGLVLVDPPFEAQEDEFRIIEEALAAAHKRFANGIYAVWYPIKLRQSVLPFHRWLKASGMRKVLAAEICVHPDNSALRLNGCGMAIINAPYKLDRTLAEILPMLATTLAQSRYAQFRLEWLVED
ncbi:MAG TPA: 23S rRNA (adenine(2030)-N(6))-methyltransferase RlmJ [Pseudomonadota bacterium]|nr:23S rRNA (adenine(2030)-N(6))-methyltransferase RlmJ [Rhodanobacteraceae bacterium]MBP9155626.1 23S rRNA (adenine(2030)-N(6))-methyltransferase RlmJ [Xanthomonadales bacterium]HQW81621.1 23S rRNA (adenine(2030)-N(6))-methyltransferase RlmJ [Pseudomonadota bacterium]